MNMGNVCVFEGEPFFDRNGVFRIDEVRQVLASRLHLVPRYRKKLRLLPGMFANVVVLVGDPRDVVTVPRTAITYSLYGDSIYVVKSADAKQGGEAAQPGNGEQKLVADRRFIKTGQARDDRVAVVSGIAAGDEVVTTGQLKLNPGATIRIDNAQPLSRPEERPKQ
jgi:membrane fusion protein (multidrug efflux system)